MFNRDKVQFQDLWSERIFLGQATKLYNFKSQSLEVVSIFCFCLFQWMSFYLGWIYKKGQCTKNFFRVSTCFSNIFTHYIQNLEIYNAFIISEPEFTVCYEITLVHLSYCSICSVQPLVLTCYCGCVVRLELAQELGICLLHEIFSSGFVLFRTGSLKFTP